MAQSDPEQLKKNLETTRELIEHTITELGLDPVKNRLSVPEPGKLGWKLRRGSAAVYVFVEAHDGANFVQVVSPLMKYNASHELPLFRYLLELNADTMYGLAFGVRDDMVLLSADRQTADLDPSEFKAMIVNVGRLGDHYDDELVKKFGGIRQRDTVP